MNPLNFCDQFEPFKKDWSTEKLSKWLNRLRFVLKLAKTTVEDDKVSTLNIVGGEELMDVLADSPEPNEEQKKAYLKTEEERKSLFEVQALKLMLFLKGNSNSMLELKKLHEIVQFPAEKISTFVDRVKQQIAKCDFKEDEVEKEVCKIVGMKTIDRDLARKMMRNEITTVQEILKEGALNEAFEMREKPQPVFENMHFVSQKNAAGSAGSYRQQMNQPNQSSKKIGCYTCGELSHQRRNCPLSQDKCYQCGGTGHFANQCPSPRNALKLNPAAVRRQGSASKRKLDMPIESTSNKKFCTLEDIHDVVDLDDDVEAVDFVGGGRTITCSIGGANLDLKLDTGTDSNIIDKKGFEILKIKKAQVTDINKNPSKKFLPFGAKDPVVPKLEFMAELKIGNKSQMARFYVLDVEGANLLGLKSAEQMQIFNMNSNVSQPAVFS